MPHNAWQTGCTRDILLSTSLFAPDECAARNIHEACRSNDQYQSTSFRREWMLTRRFFFTAMLGVAVAACGGSKSHSAPTPQPRTTISVENQGFSDMTI